MLPDVPTCAAEGTVSRVREGVRKFSRRAGESGNSRGTERLLLRKKEERIILLDGSQASPARPSDKSIVNSRR
jgi:hypothetical protein